MVSKLASLQSALSSRSTPAPAANDRPEAPPVMRAANRQSSRADKVNLAAWVDGGFKSSLRLIQAQKRATLAELMEEALNDLFAKYNVPQIETGERQKG